MNYQAMHLGTGVRFSKVPKLYEHFWVSQFPLYLKNGVDLGPQTSQSVCFLLPQKHVKRSAFLNKRLEGKRERENAETVVI